MNKWIFVYVDTLLGEVTATAGAIKDTAGHVIKEATATVKLGNNAGGTDALVTLSVTTGVSRVNRASAEVGSVVIHGVGLAERGAAGAVQSGLAVAVEHLGNILPIQGLVAGHILTAVWSCP